MTRTFSLALFIVTKPNKQPKNKNLHLEHGCDIADQHDGLFLQLPKGLERCLLPGSLKKKRKLSKFVAVHICKKQNKKMIYDLFTFVDYIFKV